MSRPQPPVRRPRTRVPATVALCAIALLLPSAAASAAPRFSSPSSLRTSASELGDPAVAVAPNARIVVAWGQRGSGGVELVARRSTSGGRFGPTQRVVRDGFAPSAAAGPTGGAAIAWQRFGAGRSRRVEVAVAPAGHGFRSPQVLATGRTIVTAVRVFAAGDRYVAVWAQDRSSSGLRAVRFAVSDTTGRFGRARTLVDDASAQTDVSAAAGPDGTVVAAWATPPHPPVNQQLVVARLGPGAATFGLPVIVRTDEPGEEAHEITAVGGPSGVALTWVGLGARGELLRTAAVSSDGSVTPTTALTFASGDRTVHHAGGPTTAAPAAGAPALAAWTVTDQTDDEVNDVIGQHVFAAVSRADGTYPAPASVDRGRDSTLPVAGATASGIVLTWRARKRAGRPALRYALARPDGTLGAARTLGSTLSPRSSEGAVVASSAHAVVAVWKTARPSAGRRGTRHGLSIAVLRDR